MSWLEAAVLMLIITGCSVSAAFIAGWGAGQFCLWFRAPKNKRGRRAK